MYRVGDTIKYIHDLDEHMIIGVNNKYTLKCTKESPRLLAQRIGIVWVMRDSYIHDTDLWALKNIKEEHLPEWF